jgi:ligand-binding sensor domain-containing protein
MDHKIQFIFIWLQVSSLSFLLAAEDVYQFEIITTRNGLSDNDIRAVTDDRYGFVWLATDEGFNRYDGYEVKSYNSNPFDTTALSGNRIWDIFKDQDGDVWALTDKGVDLYHYGKDSFQRFPTASRPTFLTQDKEELLWIATKNSGVYTIEKNTGKIVNYRFNPSDPYSISSNSFDENQCNPIVVDTSGNLWIGTTNGLNYYRKDKDFFTRFMSLEYYKNSISSNQINTLLIKGNNLYVGTSQGLDKINIGDLSIITRLAGTSWISMLGTYTVKQLLDFGSNPTMNGFWVATTAGIVYYNATFDLFDDLMWDYIFGQNINKMYVDPKGNLLVDVLAFPGLTLFNTEVFFAQMGLVLDDNFKLLQPDKNGVLSETTEPSSFTNVKVNDLHFDDMNNMWVATRVGLNQRIKTTQNFITENNLTGSNVSAVKIAPDNSIWVAHENGVDQLSKDGQVIERFTADPTNANSLLNKETGPLAILHDGQVWAASQSLGATLINPITKTYQRFYEFIDETSGSILRGKVNSIFQEYVENPNGPSYENIWFATTAGIIKCTMPKHPENALKFSIYKYEDSVQNDYLSRPSAILRDLETDELWVGTESNGLFRVKMEISSRYINDRQIKYEKFELVKHYIIDKNDPKSFSSNSVNTIVSDVNNNIWIGTSGEGLFRYNRENDNFDRWSIDNGLPSATVVSILSDNSGGLWFGTRRGIARLHTDGSVRVFDNSDGLPADIFNTGAVDINDNGILYFGSVQGLTRVNPSEIIINEIMPKLAINLVETIDYEGNRNFIDFTNNQISINHQVQTLNINFVGLSYNKSSKNQYQYTLDNYLNNWVDNGTNRTVTFQRLEPDNYNFHFRASNNDGIWNNNPYSIEIRVKPPIWQTWYAYTFYFFAFVGLSTSGFYGVDRLRRKSLENKRKDLDLAEAREFQLRMIAKKIPDYEGMDIKAFMRTSTEVGGDYYDFFELEDGSFYAVCGDATGHGSQSGMMVSITKAGLASIESNSPDDILNRLNKVVRRVDTGRLRMSLSVCIFRNDKLYISAAAMPPAYLYSAETQSVEEIEIRNLPLGGLDNEQFELVERSFNKGDILVLLSDGLPEAPDLEGNLLDYQPVMDCIEKVAHLGASQVKQAMIDLADDWLDGSQNPDDITFVVFEKQQNGDQKAQKELEEEKNFKKVAQA